MLWAVVLRVLLLVLAFSAVATAATAPDIPLGTRADAVISKYGWPRGRSEAGNRATWTYDQFEVRFQDGAVIGAIPKGPGR